jgi:mevalonate pyrophosphate decarboxylase
MGWEYIWHLWTHRDELVIAFASDYDYKFEIVFQSEWDDSCEEDEEIESTCVTIEIYKCRLNEIKALIEQVHRSCYKKDFPRFIKLVEETYYKGIIEQMLEQYKNDVKFCNMLKQ